MVDASRTLPHADELLLDRAKRFSGKTILALNKVDGLPKEKLLPLYLEAFQQKKHSSSRPSCRSPRSRAPIARIYLAEILRLLPEGETLTFPRDQVTDQPERFLAAEIVREKAIQSMYHEVPYALAVKVDKFEDSPKLLRIEATMSVERDSQKKVLIGRKGEMLKKDRHASAQGKRGVVGRYGLSRSFRGSRSGLA